MMSKPIYDDTKRCGDCALYETDACYLVTYVDEEHPACDDYIEYRRKEKKK